MEDFTLLEKNILSDLIQKEAERLQTRIQMFPEFESYRDELKIIETIKNKLSTIISH